MKRISAEEFEKREHNGHVGYYCYSHNERRIIKSHATIKTINGQMTNIHYYTTVTNGNTLTVILNLTNQIILSHASAFSGDKMFELSEDEYLEHIVKGQI